jgi:hypothetical protein
MYGEKCGYQLKVRWVDKEVKVSSSGQIKPGQASGMFVWFLVKVLQGKKEL